MKRLHQADGNRAAMPHLPGNFKSQPLGPGGPAMCFAKHQGPGDLGVLPPRLRRETRAFKNVARRSSAAPPAPWAPAEAAHLGEADTSGAFACPVCGAWASRHAFARIAHALSPPWLRLASVKEQTTFSEGVKPALASEGPLPGVGLRGGPGRSHDARDLGGEVAASLNRV